VMRVAGPGFRSPTALWPAHPPAGSRLGRGESLNGRPMPMADTRIADLRAAVSTVRTSHLGREDEGLGREGVLGGNMRVGPRELVNIRRADPAAERKPE
jgi:hypothetical protein